MGRDARLWAQKVVWMREHGDLWNDLDPNEALYMTQRERWRLILRRLQDDGLVSRKSQMLDLDLRGLIRAALDVKSESKNNEMTTNAELAARNQKV